jgi:hypothetical protein
MLRGNLYRWETVSTPNRIEAIPYRGDSVSRRSHIDAAPIHAIRAIRASTASLANASGVRVTLKNEPAEEAVGTLLPPTRPA